MPSCLGIPRGFIIVDTWDVMGMRATCSQDTVLDGAYVPDKYISRVLPAGNKGADYFILAMFAWALMGFANVYYGLARRAFDMTLEGMKKRSSIGLTRPLRWPTTRQYSMALLRCIWSWKP
jgi:alkylation response protein AidB-like acyl-CoA dehydrogenase